VAALREQLRRREAELNAGARRVGWKIGRGIVAGEEDLEPVIGYLTSTTLLPPGGVFDGAGAKELRVDAEAALELARGGGVSRVGAALELVHVARPPHDFESIVAENIWHRAVAFAPLLAKPPPDEVEARVVVNGEVRDAPRARVDFEETVTIAGRLLAAVGEQLQAGDRIIAGSILHVPVEPGDDVVVDLGELGRVGARVR
jgi:2-keto-4-pentenoate hydratase